MNDQSMLQSGLHNKLRTVSTGVKLIVVCVLALFMTIPAFFVADLVRDRTQREADVVKEISAHVGGQQTFLGPTLAIPYTIPAQPALTSQNTAYTLRFLRKPRPRSKPQQKSATAPSSRSLSSRPT